MYNLQQACGCKHGNCHIFPELGKEVTKYISSGALVPDELIISLMSKEMKTVGSKWLLDGELFASSFLTFILLHAKLPVD